MTLKDAVYQLDALRGRRPLRALHLFAGAGGLALIEIEEVGWVDSNPLNYEATWRAEFERLFPPLLPTCAKCGGYSEAAIEERARDMLQARCTCG